MDKSFNSSQISNLQKNIFETLAKIQKENSLHINGTGKDKLAIPSNLKKSSSPSATSRKDPDPCSHQKLKQFRILTPDPDLSYDKTPEKSPNNFLNHLKTTITEKTQIKPSLTLLKKFPMPISPSSELESESFDLKTQKSPNNEIFIGSSQLTSAPFPTAPITNFGSYGNLMVLFETEQKNRQLFESLFKKEQKENEELKSSLESLQANYEVEKKSSEIKLNRLLHEVKVLKMGNLELQNRLKQRHREAEYETHTLLKKSATKIAENELETMDKGELLKQFNHLKTEYKEMSKKLLKLADEMFEKNNEIKQLQTQKTDLFKELAVAKEQNFELCELKEHVAYLLDTINIMKDKLSKLAEMYRKKVQDCEDDKSDEVIRSIHSINDIARYNLASILNKKKVNYVENFYGTRLMGYLKNTLAGIIQGK